MGFQGNYFYRVSLTVAAYVAGAKTTKTYEFTQKTLKDSSSLTTYWPILLDVGEVSFTAGETLPTLSASAITIDNKRGSFGANRRFSDILQRYSPVEQSVTVYFAQVDNNIDTVSSWTTVMTGIVSDWALSAQGDAPTLTFNIKPYKFDEKVLTLEVARTVYGMENAPDGSLGRAIPLVIGNNLDVSPVRVSADLSTTGKWAYGTCLYQHLKMTASADTVLTTNYNGAWEQFTAGFNPDLSTGTPTGQYTLNTYAARAIGLNQNSPCVVGGVRLYMHSNGTGPASTGLLSVFIIRIDAFTFNVVDEMARGTVQLSNYDTYNNNPGTYANFYINVSFDRLAFLSIGEGRYFYALGWEVTGFTPDDASINYRSVTTFEFRKDAADATAGSNNSYSEWKYAGGAVRPMYKLHEVTPAFDGHVNAFTNTGLTYATVTLTQPSPDTGQTNPNFDSFPLVVGVGSGLVNYSGGTAVNYLDTLPSKLSFQWSTASNSWADANAWDTTTLGTSHAPYLTTGVSPTFRSRTPEGVIDQKATFAQVVAEMCRGTACKVGILSTGKAFTWMWGLNEAVGADIPAADITALEWQQRDTSSIVNRALLKLGRKYAVNSSGDSGTVDSSRYSSDYSATNYPQVAAMTAESIGMYGPKDLAQNSFVLYATANGGVNNYLGGPDSWASVTSEYYLSRFAKPLVYASFVVPWHRYNSLRMFQVVTFQSTDFPAFYGTDPEQGPMVVDTGTTVVTVPGWNGGEELVRAETYRGIIEGVSYVLAMEHAPAIRLTVLVLLNQPCDPT